MRETGSGSLLAADLAAIFRDQGPLAQALPGYRYRPQQAEFAQAVAAAIEARAQLIAEAGTGTGKTFAYLVPALLSGGKVIISTGTKTLQDQLFERDLPRVRDALRVPVTVALLKGRANYVCHYHLERTASEGRLVSRQDVRYLHKIRVFAQSSTTGDKAQLADVPEGASIWPLVTSTRENCLGSECPHHKQCFVLAARRDALAADVVVVNHHLFFADIALRDEGLAELLPACNTVICDEAHQLPDTATMFFGEQVTAGQMLELARDAQAEAGRNAAEAKSLPTAADELALAVRKFRLASGFDTGKFTRAQLASRTSFESELDALCVALSTLADELQAHAPRSEGLALCFHRAGDFARRLDLWRRQDDLDWIRWLDLTQTGWQLHASPLSVADVFRAQVDAAARAWIFTSATLAVRGDFSHFQHEMGLEAAATACWDSPFQYREQALLYVPRELPEPSSAAHTQAVVEAALPVVRAAGGGAFLLFTTLRALQRARDLVTEAMQREGMDFPLLVQGDAPRGELLARFREHGDAVLLGSQSFWEGVDVRGEALAVVVIDKLPFAPPDDPILAARLERLAQSGGNPFFDYQLPQAAISLKQGAGRLIRSETDRGVLMICDTRLVEKPYGKRLWQSLPPMRRTRDLADVVAFFSAGAAQEVREPDAEAGASFAAG
jgi:ATP-dependent DNA helicase DinG